MISKKITIEFDKLKHEIVEANIAVGMITDKNFDFFMRNVKSAESISIVTGVHMQTPPSLFEKLRVADLENKLQARIFTTNFFHAKVYLFKLKSKWIAYVGSGNFTGGGWGKNEELFVTVTDQSVCADLKNRFDQWFSQSQKITPDFINKYNSTFVTNQSKEKEKNKNIQQLLDQINNEFNIQNVDFTGQYFSRIHHEAFAPGKTHRETQEILEERRLVRSRLYRLNDLLVLRIPFSWAIHPHYENEHIVAHIENNFHHDYNVVGLWVAYGRAKQSLKIYGEKATPLVFMRMQVIVGYDYVGVWLMPGKSGAGQIDREHFAHRMTGEEYRINFYDLLKGLGSSYWIEIAGEKRNTDSFESSDLLWEYTQTDDWRYYYFIIGRDYSLGSKELLENNIIQTIVNDFTKYISLYELIRDKTFD